MHFVLTKFFNYCILINAIRLPEGISVLSSWSRQADTQWNQIRGWLRSDINSVSAVPKMRMGLFQTEKLEDGINVKGKICSVRSTHVLMTTRTNFKVTG